MNNTNTGGPAFPLKEPMSNDFQGMTLREALAEQPAEQRSDSEHREPVAWLVESKHGNWAPYLEWSEPSYLETQVVTPLYTSPQPSKPWVGLTDEERGQVINANFGTGLWAMAKDIEAKLKEKNT